MNINRIESKLTQKYFPPIFPTNHQDYFPNLTLCSIGQNEIPLNCARLDR